jgi:hypothetical protein
MSTLPPGAPGAPQSQGQGPAGDTPRWAAPAVPPPWAGQTPPAADVASAPAPPAQGWAPVPGAVPQGWPQPVAPRTSFNRQKWLPTVAVAAVIAGVVLGGIGLDRAIAAPSAGTLELGNGATLTAAPGWAKVESGDSSGVTLQKGNTRFVVVAVPFQGSAHEIVIATEKELNSELDSIQFGEVTDTTWSGHDTSVVGFSAVVSGSGGSGGGTLDGVVIGMIVKSDGIQMLAVAPVGMLDSSAADDIKAMAASIEVR